MEVNQKIVIYDIEIYPNLFLIVFFDIRTREYKVFIISPFRDDRNRLMKYLKTLDLMIGFNNLEFDYPILNLLIVLLNKNISMYGKDLVRELKNKANQIIRSGRNAKNIIYNPVIPQLDLYKMHHFDNVAKSTSLKALEFVLRMRDIRTLPYPPDKVLNELQIDKVVDYCIHDIDTTYKFFTESTQQIVLRERLSQVFSIPKNSILNWNDPKIGEIILVNAIKRKMGKDSLGQTIRKKIVVKDILFSYLNYYSPEFNAI